MSEDGWRKTRMTALGVSTQFVGVTAERPTGVALVTMSPDGEPRFEIPRPAAFDFVDMPPEALERAKRLKPDWLYFGTLIHTDEHAEQITRQYERVAAGRTVLL